MPLSWNEIRHNAIRFSHEWSEEHREDAEAKTFWDEFFQVFGIRRRTVATFEEPVRNLGGDYSYIDLFWRGVLLVEHKSRGKDLGKAESQAFRYIQDLARGGRQEEVPRYVIVSDFARVALHDMEPDEQLDLPLFNGHRVRTVEFPLADFHKHIHEFAFISGYKTHRYEEQDPINLKAVEIMGRLHDALEMGGYTGHDLERFLVRILFCLFAEDTGIFEPQSFQLYLENRTAADGSDLGPHLAHLFELLNTPPERRQKNLDEALAAFPYVNGELFGERLGFADFDHRMRDALLTCTHFDWSRISPAIFGSLFQAVMEPRERRQIGGHYTSERDILKVIRSLFLDNLREKFEHIRNRKADLRRFHEELAGLRFLDPACGCGNFLVITYRELRLLEIEVLKLLHSEDQRTLDIQHLSRLDVDAFFGIEIGEWPARIAEVALWLMDHQMNLRLSEAFGQYFVRLPLRKSPRIVCGNALRLDWKEILPPEQCSYVLGNPPFVGHHYQSAEQKEDQRSVLAGFSAGGVLDYVSNWYVRAAQYILGTRIVVGLVSTNSITQGEQAGILWSELIGRYGIKIHFAHRTFAWESEARGRAHVHVVIIGFAAFEVPAKRIFDYEADPAHPSTATVRNISPYLVEGPDLVVMNRSTPLADVPKMLWGNKPTDGGHLILSSAERDELLTEEPGASPFIRPYMSGGDFINGIERYCLWLKDVDPARLRRLPRVMERVEAVRRFRLESRAESTRRYADFPTLFRQIAQPESDYLAVPEVSSERRIYIPIAFVPHIVICSNKIQFVPQATLWHFGVLTSTMHMAWVRQVCGRLESRLSYSNTLVYNTFPWPEEPTPARRQAVEEAAQRVLDTRKQYLEPDGMPEGMLMAADSDPATRRTTLADLYDPLSMPPDLV